MKRIAIIVAVLGVCVLGYGQDKPAAQSTATAGQAATPPGKRPPQAKTQTGI